MTLPQPFKSGLNLDLALFELARRTALRPLSGDSENLEDVIGV